MSGVWFGFFSFDPPLRYAVGLPKMSSDETVTWSIDSPCRSGMSRKPNVNWPKKKTWIRSVISSDPSFATRTETSLFSRS